MNNPSLKQIAEWKQRISAGLEYFQERKTPYDDPTYKDYMTAAVQCQRAEANVIENIIKVQSLLSTAIQYGSHEQYQLYAVLCELKGEQS